MFVIDSKERIKDSDEFACIFIDYNSSLKNIMYTAVDKRW